MDINRLKRLLIGFSIGLILGIIFASLAHAGDTTGLEGAWLLDEESGTRVDETANNNDLTDNNTVLFATGQFGNAADFEKDNTEFLSITDASQTGLDLASTDLTILAFVKAETTVEGNIVSKASTSGYKFLSTGSGKLEFSIKAGADAGSSATLTPGTFFHVAITYDNVTMRLFIDGSADGTAANTNTIPDTSDDFNIGGLLGLETWDGLIDEVAVFSRELSSGERDDIKDNGLEAFISPAAAFLPRVILMTSVLGYPGSKVYYYGLVNSHRKKFNIERPQWMKLFDIPEAFAKIPDVVDKTNTMTEFDNRETDQIAYKTTNGRYKQKWPVVKNGITYETHEYLGPRGVGYIQRAIKTDTDTGKKYVLEKHIGPETDRAIATEWTEIVEEP